MYSSVTEDEDEGMRMEEKLNHSITFTPGK